MRIHQSSYARLLCIGDYGSRMYWDKSLAFVDRNCIIFILRKRINDWINVLVKSVKRGLSQPKHSVQFYKYKYTRSTQSIRYFVLFSYSLAIWQWIEWICVISICSMVLFNETPATTITINAINKNACTMLKVNWIRVPAFRKKQRTKKKK